MTTVKVVLSQPEIMIINYQTSNTPEILMAPRTA